jgi:hypothetical protein
VRGIRGQRRDLFISPVELSKDVSLVSVLWRIDPLLGKDSETNNETVVTMQRRSKHAFTTTVLLLGTVFSTRSVKTSYLEDNWGDPVKPVWRRGRIPPP